jgi:hypothetical protein
MAERAAWVEAVYEFLNRRDGAAPLRQVAETAAALVPPGPAWREGNAKRKTDARYRGGIGDELPDLNDLSVIRTGQKRIVLKSIYYERKAGRLEKYDLDGRSWLRVLESDG